MHVFIFCNVTQPLCHLHYKSLYKGQEDNLQRILPPLVCWMVWMKVHGGWGRFRKSERKLGPIGELLANQLTFIVAMWIHVKRISWPSFMVFIQCFIKGSWLIQIQIWPCILWMNRRGYNHLHYYHVYNPTHNLYLRDLDDATSLNDFVNNIN